MAADAEVCELTFEDSSPVHELSFSLQNLQCQDGLHSKDSTPWRKLVMTPECISQSLNEPSWERETPTDLSLVSAVRRRRTRSLSPEFSSNTSRCLWRNKENERGIQKRLRVRLSSRFSTDERASAGRVWRQYRSDPEEDASHSREIETLSPAAAVRFRQLRSRLEAPPTPVTQDAVADLTLIGDFSKQHLLPVESAGHQELHCVSAHTVASLIRGQFGAAVEDFLIVDCRFPYEYQGGHIKGAVNLYSESQIQQVLHEVSAADQLSVSSRQAGPSDERSSPRKLMVFHCEYSSERGPHLCQHLRRVDRCVNPYPSLHYPELYLLLGGYRHFHASYPDLCDPCGYVPMRQHEYREQLHGFLRKRHTRLRRRRPIRILQRTTR